MFLDIVMEKCGTTMLHGDMTLSRRMVYTQSIEQSKIWRRSRDANRGRIEDKVQPQFKKRGPNKDGRSAPKANYDRGGGSQVVKSTCSTLGKSTLGCFQPELVGALVVGRMTTR